MAGDDWWESLRRIRESAGTTPEDDALAEEILQAVASGMPTDEQYVQAYDLGRKYGRIPDALSYEAYLETFAPEAEDATTNTTPVLPELPELSLDIDIPEDDFSDIMSETDFLNLDTSVPNVPLMSHRIPGLKFVSDNGEEIEYEYPVDLDAATVVADAVNHGSSGAAPSNDTVDVVTKAVDETPDESAVDVGTGDETGDKTGAGAGGGDGYMAKEVLRFAVWRPAY